MGALDSTASAYPLSSSQPSRLPPPVPISDSSDPDAIALRSALSVLQIQRLRSVQDVQTLSRQKQMALANPEAFAKALADGKVQTSSQRDILGILDDEDSSPEDEQPDNAPNGVHQDSTELNQSFSHIPRAQTVVRCPPINWAKYQIVGDALESLHERQRRRPEPGEAKKPESTPAAHVVAAPYNPLKDTLPSNPANTKPERDP